MNDLLLNILIVLLLIGAEGLFAGAEIALISLRDGQIKRLAETGRRGAAIAHLTRDPNRFLSAVQIGVTLTGFLASAFGAVTLSGDLADALVRAGWHRGLADALSLIGVTLVISFVTLVLGELVPKRIALAGSEKISRAVGLPLDLFATMARPAIWLLSLSTNAVVRLLGGDPSSKAQAMSEDELRDLVASHEALEPDQRRFIDDVFEAGQTQVREIMVPRTEVEFVDGSATIRSVRGEILAGTHSRLPVYRSNQDDVIGFVHLRDIATVRESELDHAVATIARPILAVPDSRPALAALADLRQRGAHIAVVVDEYGGTAGIITLEDIIEELVGDIRDEYDIETDDATRDAVGDVDVDGLLNIEDFAEETGVELPEGPYETVAGYVVSVLARMPELGDRVMAGTPRTEAVDLAATDADAEPAVALTGGPGMAELIVTELDGRRISRIHVHRAEPVQVVADPQPPAGDAP